MRIRLQEVDKKRMRFRATVERFGKTSYEEEMTKTILLKNVRFADNDVLATDHIWLKVGKTIKKMNLQPGETIEFDARVSAYKKGYVNKRNQINTKRTDYKLNYPTKFSKI